MLTNDVKMGITQTENYYKYNTSDLITHIKYVKHTHEALLKPKTCTWQGKNSNGKTVYLYKK